MLRGAYRRARTQILSFSDPVEQSLALASLRLRATHFLNEANSTLENVEPNAWAPLKDYVATLGGGETAETSVAVLDATAKRAAEAVLSGILSSLAGATWLAGVTAAVSLGISATIRFGGWLSTEVWPLLLAAHLPLGLMAMKAGSMVLALDGEVRGRVASLGRAGENAMSEAARVETEIWRTATGLPWHQTPFSEKARRRVELMLWLTYGLLGLAVLLIAYGVYSAFVMKSQVPSLLSPVHSFS